MVFLVGLRFDESRVQDSGVSTPPPQISYDHSIKGALLTFVSLAPPVFLTTPNRSATRCHPQEQWTVYWTSNAFVRPLVVGLVSGRVPLHGHKFPS